MADRSLRILFNARHLGYVRHYERLVNELSSGGHHVRLICEPDKEPESGRLLQSLGELPGIDIVRTSSGPDRSIFVESLRALRNYLKYLEPEFEGTDALVARAARRVPKGVRRRFDKTKGRPAMRRRVAERIARTIDEWAPPAPSVSAITEDFDPDIVLVTPLVDLGGEGGDYIKAARSHGRPSALVVASWDNLTNKGRMPIVPERVVVWNEVQRDEASQLHGVPSDSVVVTGAQTFDEWFERRPKRSTPEFLGMIGASPDRPTILYLVSSGFIGGVGSGEHEFIDDWAGAIRRSTDPMIRDANIIVRPHPKVDPGPLHAMTDKHSLIVWPSFSTFVVGEDARQDYVDQLGAADVAVGINTSAFIESVIAGVPVLTVLDPRFSLAQEGTIHFRYLRDGGALDVDANLDDHLERMGKLLRSDPDEARRERFLRWFVRPYGLHEEASPRLLDAVVSLGDVKARGRKPKRFMGPLVRLADKLLLMHPEIQARETRMRGKQPKERAPSGLGRKGKARRRKYKDRKRAHKEGADVQPDR